MTGHGNKYRLFLSLSMTLLTDDDDSNDCHALVVAHLLHLQVYLIIWYRYVYLAITALWLLGVTCLQQFPTIISLLITETRARDPKVWGINRFQCLKLFLIGLNKPLECQWILSISVYGLYVLVGTQEIQTYDGLPMGNSWHTSTWPESPNHVMSQTHKDPSTAL